MKQRSNSGLQHVLHRAALLSTLSTIVAINSVAFGQQGKIGLQHIAFGNTNGTLNRPERGWADALGGEYFVTIQVADNFVETVHVNWSFDKSIRTLSAGEQFRMTLKIRVSKPGNASNDPKKYGSIANYYVQGSNFKNGNPQVGPDLIEGSSQQLINGPVATHDRIKHLIVYARADSGEPGDGYWAKGNHIQSATGVYTVAESIRGDSMDGFYFKFMTYPGLGSNEQGKRRNCNFEIAYIYKAGAAGAAKKVTIGDGELPERDDGGSRDDKDARDDGGTKKDDKSDDGFPPGLPGRYGNEILPPWFPPNAGNRLPPRPTTRHRPNGWLDCERNWPPVVVVRNPGGGSPSTGTPDDWWEDGPPDGSPPNRTNGGARILLAGKRRVAVGKEATVPVYLFFPRGTAALNFEVKYNPAVVTPTSDPDRGAVFGGGVRFSGESRESGVLRIGFAQSQPVSRSGIVANLRFRAVGSPGDRSDLLLNVYDLKDSNRRPLAMDLYDGEIEIVRKYRSGDSDGDDVLTVFDAQRAIDMSTKKIEEDLTLDMDDSGGVLATDSLIILQRIDVRQNRFGSR